MVQLALPCYAVVECLLPHATPGGRLFPWASPQHT